MGSIWIGLAGLWAIAVGELIFETGQGRDGIAVFGVALADPGRPATFWIVAGLAASASLAMAIAVGAARGRHLERRMARDLDGRFDRLAEREAELRKRRDAVAERVAELHRRTEALARERDRVERAVEAERRRAREIRTVTARTVRAVDEMARELETGAERLVVLPDDEQPDELAVRRATKTDP